jgi:hypothetical protein
MKYLTFALLVYVLQGRGSAFSMRASHGGRNSVLDHHGRSGFVILQYCSAINSQLSELGSELSIVLKFL